MAEKRKTQQASKAGDTLWGKLKKRVGETGEVLDAGIAWTERQAKQTADMNVPVLSKAADAVVQPALLFARATIANATSGGGKYYQPEVRDERYFSNAALRELGASVQGVKGRAAGRADGMDNAAQFNLTQTIGGFSVQNGAVTDKFDINKSYYAVPNAATKVARFVLGAEEDPDAGKIKTRIPLDKLGVQQASKAGDTYAPNVPVEEPVPQAAEPVPEGGPRIVINPEVFEDKRDALCVAMNEAFRVLMEVNGFNPVSEPTEAQRQFFADTAYSQNENQMRRTILARICTFDTSVKDPTNEQLAESVEFLETVMEMGAPQNQWEQQAVQRIHDVLVAAMEQGTAGGNEPYTKPPVDEPAGDQRQEQADVGGGAVDEEIRRVAGMGEGTSVTEDTSTLEERQKFLEERGMDTDLAETGSMEQLQRLHMEQTEAAASTEPAVAQTNEAQPAVQEPQPAVQEPQPAVQGPQRDDTGHYRDDAGRIISQRAAQKLYDAKMAGSSSRPSTDSSTADAQSTRYGSKYSRLTRGEIEWQKRKAASTAAWKRRTGRA